MDGRAQSMALNMGGNWAAPGEVLGQPPQELPSALWVWISPRNIYLLLEMTFPAMDIRIHIAFPGVDVQARRGGCRGRDHHE